MYYARFLVVCCFAFRIAAQQTQFKLTQNLENQELITRYMHLCATSKLDTPLAAYTPLREELCKRMLEKTDLNLVDEQGKNALMYACENNHGDLVVLFGEAGANLKLQDNAGESALMKAASCGNASLLKYLLSKDSTLVHQFANESCKRNASSKWTALTYAVVHNAYSAIAILITSGASRDIQDKWGQTLMGLAKLKKTRDYLAMSDDELEKIAQRILVPSSLILNSPTRSPLSTTFDTLLPNFSQTNSPILSVYQPAESRDAKPEIDGREMAALEI